MINKKKRMRKIDLFVLNALLKIKQILKSVKFAQQKIQIF